MGKIRLCLIGVGNWGKNIARVIKESEILELAGISDIDKSRAEWAGKTFSTQWFTDYTVMLERVKPDGVAIAVPAKYLGKVALDVIKHGFSAFVEKPVATNSKEAEMIKREAIKRNVVVMPGFIMRFNPVILELKRMINKFTDKWEVVVFRRLSRRPEWRRSVPIIYDLSIHDIDLIRYLLGEIKGAKNVFISRRGGDDMVVAVLELEDDTDAIIHTDGVSLAKIREIDLESSNVFIRADTERLTIRVKTMNTDETISIKYYEPLKRELESFGKILRGEMLEVPSIDDAIRALEVIEEITRHSIKDAEND